MIEFVYHFGAVFQAAGLALILPVLLAVGTGYPHEGIVLFMVAFLIVGTIAKGFPSRVADEVEGRMR